MNDLFPRLISSFADIFAPLIEVADDPQALETFLADLGYAVPHTPAGTPTLVGVSALLDHVEELEELLDNQQVEDTALAAAILAVTKDISDVVGGLEGLETWLSDNFGVSSDFIAKSNLQELPRRLIDFLLLKYLEEELPASHAALTLIGLVESYDVEASDEAYQSAHRAHIVRWDRIEGLFLDPGQILKQVYGCGPDIQLETLFERIQDLAVSMGIPAVVDTPHEAAFARLNPAAELTEDRTVLIVPVFFDSTPGTGFEVGFEVYPLHSANGSIGGVSFVLYAEGSIMQKIDLPEGFVIEIAASGALDDGLGVWLVDTDRGIEFGVTTDLFSAVDVETARSLDVSVGLKSPNHEQPRVILDSYGLFVSVGALVAKIDVNQRGQHGPEFGGEVDIRGLALAIPTENADGFLQKILSGVEIGSTCDLTVGYTNVGGLYFRGSGALEVRIPIHDTLGPLNSTDILIAVAIAEGLELTLAISFGLELGPIAGTVKDIGVRIGAAFPDDGSGNLGPLEIQAPKFKPPSGAGLSLSAGGISGGGFLDFDEPNKRYSGSLALNFGEIGLTAIGLITTRMPDGSDGFSLLVNIGVTFDPPIQLSFGFTLNGVGGLIGVNRTMEIEVLQRGIRNQTLDSILFPDPETVVANASKIISDLRSVFPPAEGRFVVGPMVKIGWGTPAIISAEIGVFLELPDPIRVVLMGQLSAALPDKETDLVAINLDILGVLDLAKEELTFQASLYDSHVLAFMMFGDAAFLLGWGNDPRFGLSLGGFHPKFTPPPPPIIFSDLKRLTISISSGKNCQLTCRAYQALTPNSLQFGARVDLYAAGGGAEVAGYMGFDALIYFSPFSFEVWIGAGVSLKYEGVSLLDVELSFLLAGPTPWLVRGKAKIKILFVSIKVGFEITWGSKEQATLAPVDPWIPFKDAVLAAGNWGSVLPEGRTIVEALRARDESAPEEIVMHPASRIEVRQKVVPLGIGLSKSGNAPIGDHDLFDISHLGALIVKRDSEGNPITDGEGNPEFEDLQPPESVSEYFARGQCEDLDSAQRLSVPAFEKMKGGVVSATREAIRLEGEAEHKPLGYESILIRPDRTSQRQKDRKGTLDWAEGKNIAKAGTRRRAIQRAGVRKRFGTLREPPKVKAVEEFYCIARADDLMRAAIGQENRNLTRIKADQTLAAYLELQSGQAERLIVVPEWEVFEEAV